MEKYQNLEQIVMFQNQEMLLEEVAERVSVLSSVIDDNSLIYALKHLESKGVLKFIEHLTPEEEIIKDLENALEDFGNTNALVEESETYLDYKARKRAEGQAKHNAASVIVPALSLANDLEAYALNVVRIPKENIRAEQNPDGTFTMEFLNIHQNELNKLDKYYKVKMTKENISLGIEKTGKGISNTVSFTMNSVVNPVAKSTLAVSSSVLKTAAESSVLIGASIVNSTVEEAQRFKYDMSRNKDAQVAKQRMRNGYNTVAMKIFGRKKATGFNVR